MDDIHNLVDPPEEDPDLLTNKAVDESSKKSKMSKTEFMSMVNGSIDINDREQT